MSWKETSEIWYLPSVDHFLGALCLTCLLLGTPSNLTALIYFSKKRARDTPTLLYVVITLTDTVTCVLVTPVAVTMFSGRNPGVFGSFTLCNVWGLLWEIQPYYSVFLVFMLTVLRTVSLVKPLFVIKTRRVFAVLIGYYLFLVVRFIVGLAANQGRYRYEAKDGYPYNHFTNPWFAQWDIVAGVTLLAFPIIPVAVSCVMSVYIVRSSTSACQEEVTSRRGRKRNSKHRATTTILLLTTIYIVFNIPVFINYIRLLIIVFGSSHQDFLNPDGNNKFVHAYSWLFTYIMSVALNALVNPIVYFFRMVRFRKAIKDIWVCKLESRNLESSITMVSNRVVPVLPGGYKDQQFELTSPSSVGLVIQNESTLEYVTDKSRRVSRVSLHSLGLGRRVSRVSIGLARRDSRVSVSLARKESMGTLSLA